MRPLANQTKEENDNVEVKIRKEIEEKKDKKSIRFVLFSILKNPYFILVAISQAIASLGFFIPFIYLPDMAVLKGFPLVDSNFLLSIIGEKTKIDKMLS